MVSLRSVTADDWQRWRDLRLRALEEAPDAFGSSYADWAEAPEQRWRDRLSIPGAVDLVADDGGHGAQDGQDVGMATMVPEPGGEQGVAELISLWVAPEVRGRGVGEALVSSVVAAARATGCRTLRLDVRETNAPARALYARLGLTEVGPNPDDPGEVRLETGLEPTDPDDRSARAVAAAQRHGLRYAVTRHGRVRSLEEAARARGVTPSAVVKTLVVRVREGEHVLVLVPGDREIGWPRLRGLLGVNRLSMPDARAAFEATGYVRGTITPLGTEPAWPVVVDAAVTGVVSLGGGAHGVALTVDAAELVARLADEVDVTVAEVSDPPGA